VKIGKAYALPESKSERGTAHTIYKHPVSLPNYRLMRLCAPYRGVGLNSHENRRFRPTNHHDN